mgnify:CR=1 FL=1
MGIAFLTDLQFDCILIYFRYFFIVNHLLATLIPVKLISCLSYKLNGLNDIKNPQGKSSGITCKYWFDLALMSCLLTPSILFRHFHWSIQTMVHLPCIDYAHSQLLNWSWLADALQVTISNIIPGAIKRTYHQECILYIFRFLDSSCALTAVQANKETKRASTEPELELVWALLFSRVFNKLYIIHIGYWKWCCW